jgi:hypothetical protein
MTSLLSHTDYSRARLLHLLDELEVDPSPDAESTALLPGEQPDFVPACIATSLWDELVQQVSHASTGAYLFLATGSALLVAPPFPVKTAFRLPGYRTEPLRRLLLARRRLAALLLRYGGWAVGIYDGDTLLEGRNGGRFVKNRHRKGGQSQRRFDRIREKQIDLLYEQACNAALERLTPRAAELDFLLFGGDRHTVQAFRKECVAIEALPVRVLPRFLTVPEPRHETLERLPALLSTSHVVRWSRDNAPI